VKLGPTASYLIVAHRRNLQGRRDELQGARQGIDILVIALRFV
jgi:hypothetical protein